VTPADRFAAVPARQRDLIGLWLPVTLENASALEPAGQANPDAAIPAASATSAARDGSPVEFDRVVPPSGNMIVCQRQFWMGPHRAGMVARIWADCDLIHVLISGSGSRPSAPTCRSATSPGSSPRGTTAVRRFLPARAGLARTRGRGAVKPGRRMSARGILPPDEGILRVRGYVPDRPSDCPSQGDQCEAGGGVTPRPARK